MMKRQGQSEGLSRSAGVWIITRGDYVALSVEDTSSCWPIFLSCSFYEFSWACNNTCSLHAECGRKGGAFIDVETPE